MLRHRSSLGRIALIRAVIARSGRARCATKRGTHWIEPGSGCCRRPPSLPPSDLPGEHDAERTRFIA